MALSIRMFPWRRDMYLRTVAACPPLKGKIMWVSMGAGKTPATIGYLRNFANTDYHVVISVPAPLVEQWHDELRKFGGEGPSVVTHEALLADPRGTMCVDARPVLLVVDEAHRLTEFFSDARTSSLRTRSRVFTELANLPTRLLCLTGTPTVHSLSDIRFLAFLCGQHRMPLAERDFHARYYKVSTWDVALHGYILPILRGGTLGEWIMHVIVILLVSMVVASLLNRWMKGSKPDQTVGVRQRRENVRELLESDRNPTFLYVDMLREKGFADTLSGMLSLSPSAPSMGAAVKESMQGDGVVLDAIKAGDEEVETVDGEDVTIRNQTEAVLAVPEVQQLLNAQKVTNTVTRAVSFTVASTLVGILARIGTVMLKLMRMKHVYERGKLQTQLLGADLRPVLVYYSPPYLRAQTTTADIEAQTPAALLKDYARLQLHRTRVRMSRQEYGVLQRMVLASDSMQPEDLHRMALLTGPEHELGRMALADTVTGTMDLYNVGRSVGMVSKLQKMLELMVRWSREERVVVFSDFSGALSLAQLMLRQRFPDRMVVRLQGVAQEARSSMLDELANTPGSVLLLDAQFAEGLTVRATTRLIMLEPPSTLSRFGQIVARVRRYRVHAPGSVVHVHELVSTLPPLPTRAWHRMKEWLSTERGRMLGPFAAQLYRYAHPSGLSPDEVVRRKRISMGKDISAMHLDEAMPMPAVLNCAPLGLEADPLVEGKEPCTEWFQTHQEEERQCRQAEHTHQGDEEEADE